MEVGAMGIAQQDTQALIERIKALWRDCRHVPTMVAFADAITALEATLWSFDMDAAPEWELVLAHWHGCYYQTAMRYEGKWFKAGGVEIPTPPASWQHINPPGE